MAIHIQQALHDLAARAFGPEWRAMRTLMKHWNMIVGEEFARHATPTGIKPVKGPGRETARLFVRIPGSLAPQFQMQEHLMLERINQLLGYGYVSSIVFEHQVGNRDEGTKGT